eukprot:CAMPEP_0194270766 /NCGR_PEP_ID=MMETSP0169-20130528/4686_1 /TAXON_ID=218684 /ORGANISM="Corethron pennatum, Strain L29A3" /LENGTH=258 /DNA_ID=CAMNT_0039012927 /DNA_START=145 /DNA_END=922 /DNA_ORIENTATION=-
MIFSELFDEKMHPDGRTQTPVDFRPEEMSSTSKSRIPSREIEMEIEPSTKYAFRPASVFTVFTHQFYSHHQPSYLHPHSEDQPPRSYAPRGAAATRLQVQVVGVTAFPALNDLVLKNIPDRVIREHHAVKKYNVGKERREHPEFQIYEQGGEGGVEEVQVDRRPVGGVAERHQEGRDQSAPRGGRGFPPTACDHEYHPPERLSQIARRRDEAPAATDIFCDAPGVGENFYSPDLPTRQPAGYGMGKFVYESRQEAYRF